MKLNGQQKGKLIRRGISLAAALAMLLNETYVWTILEDIPLLKENEVRTEITAFAEDEPVVEKKYKHKSDVVGSEDYEVKVKIEEFVQYSIECQTFPEYHQYDRVKLYAINTSDYFEYGFRGLGTPNYPFGGSVEIEDQNSINLILDAPLFNDVYDSVKLLNNGRPFAITRWYQLKSEIEETTPLIASNVYFDPNNRIETTDPDTAETIVTYRSGSYPVAWNISVTTPTAENCGDLQQFGGFIGTMKYDSTNSQGANLIVDVNMDTIGSDTFDVAIAGKEDLGLACGHMEQNTELSFTLNGTRAVSEITTSGSGEIGKGDVGGFVGEMEQGALFELYSPDAVKSGIDIKTTGNDCYAGGIVGRNTGGTVNILQIDENDAPNPSPDPDPDASGEEGAGESGIEEISYVPAKYSVTQNIEGTSGAGGVYGYYKPYTALTGENSFNTDLYTINCQVNGNGYTGGLFGVLEIESDMTIVGSAIDPEDPDADTHKIISKHHQNNDSGSCTAYGGLVGEYKADDLGCVLTVDTVTTVPDKEEIALYYGGGIGKIDQSSYVKFSTFTVDGAKNANTLTFGGLVACGDNAFVDAYDVAVSIDNNGTFKGGAIIGHTESGVVRLSGTTTLTGARSAEPASGEELKVGQLVGYRNNALVFAENDWVLNRYNGSIEVDDIGAWGEVIRFSGKETSTSTQGDVTSTITSEKIGNGTVLTVNETAHTVTVPAVTYSAIGNTADFARAALSFQFSDTSLLQITTEPAETGNSVKLSGDVSLAGTGITGLTRDNDVSGNGAMTNCVFNGTFDGNSNKVTLAVGEYYGHRGGSAITNNNTNGSGKIYRHKFNGLIAKIANGTIKNLDIDGSITVAERLDYIRVGAAAAQASGAFTADDVDVSTIMSFNGSSALYLGGILGEASTGIGNIEIKNGCSVAAGISGTNTHESTCIGGVIGRISHNSDANIVWAFSDLEVTGTVENDGAQTDSKIGGLVAEIPCTFVENINQRKLTINNVDIKGLSIIGNGSSSMGGLLGHTWLKTDVEIGTDNALTVQNKSSNKPTVQNTAAGGIGGLVYRATGKWTVKNLDIKNIVVKCSGDVGMIVNKGISVDTDNKKSAIYLCLPYGYLYDLAIDSSSTFGTGKVFDELCAYTASNANNVLKNGNGVISVSTEFHTDGSTASGSYHARTSRGAVANPNSRYYYNLDTVTANSTASSIFTYDESTNPKANSNKLMSWALNQYACTNLKKHFADPFGNTITDAVYDMRDFSWYPVDLDKDITVEGTFKFYSREFGLSETEKSTSESVNSYNRTNLESTKTQHYMMHFGLFRNVSSGKTLKVGETVFQGNVGRLNTGGSGALICGKVEGTTNSTKATVNITGPLSLDGVYVYNATGGSNPNYAPLLINQAGNFVDLIITNVSTTAAYRDNASVPYITKVTENGVSYPKAASSLIGNVGIDETPTGISITFQGIRLDGRTSDVSVADFNTELDSVYGTYRTIFTHATLLEQFKYESGSIGKYDYKSEEDWKSGHHYTVTGDDIAYIGVTYGKEVGYTSSDTNTEYPGLERKYSGSTIYTSPIPTSDEESDAYNFLSGFLPYVYRPYKYNNDTTYHQLRVNHEAATAQGCGTYNDPYLLTNSAKLEQYCAWLNTGFTSGDSIPIPMAGLESSGGAITKIGGTWCTEQQAHVVFTYDSADSNNQVFKGTVDNVEYTISPTVMRTYLAGAYYRIPDTSGDITIPATAEDGHKYDFTGLGNTADDFAVFRGIIDGNGRTITNNTGYPLIESSNGSVVKDLNIKVESNITLKGVKNVFTSNNYVNSNDTDRAYGAVMGKIFGGDNIIDNVSLNLGSASKKITITISGRGQLVPVGGYVGVVVNGGLFFRNMDRTVEVDGEIQDVLYDESLFDNVTFSDSSASVSDENMKWLYINPIIGRVLNGFAVTETDTYRPFEDGTRTYPDGSTETYNGRVTMQNGTKNYSIADINMNDTNGLAMDGIAGGSNIMASSAQGLFIMSLITECGLGKSPNGHYYQTTGVEYSLKPYNNYMATHLASYDYVGDESLKTGDAPTASASNTNGQNDYLAAAGDVYFGYGTDKLPYLIKHYTNELIGGVYPAFGIAGNAESDQFYNLKLSGDDTTFYLPDGYRGIGSLMFGCYPKENNKEKNLDDTKDYVVFLYSFDGANNGNNKTVSLNMDLRVYGDDNYSTLTNNQAFFKTGYALINCLQSKGTSDAHQFKNLTIKGSVNSELIHTDGNLLDFYAANVRKSSPAVAAFVGVPVPEKSTNPTAYNIYFKDIQLESMELSGVTFAGGYVGALNMAGELSFSGCSADDLKVFAGSAAGGLIGYMRHKEARLSADFANGNENGRFGIISIVSAIATTDKDSVGIGAGGLIGERLTSQDPVDSQNISISNVVICNGTSVPDGGYIGCIKNADGTYGNPNLVPAGGIVGSGGKTTFMSIDDVTIKNINICGAYSGGMVGRLYGENSNITVRGGSKVTTDTEPKCAIESTYNNSAAAAGGFIGKNEGPLISTITDSVLDGYIVKGYHNVGGLVGYNASSTAGVKATNLTMKNHEIYGDNNVGGMVGYNQVGTLMGYNILVNDQTIDKFADSMTNGGYIVGKNESLVKLAGFSRQGTIGDNEVKMVGNTASGAAENYGTGGYVIFADYTDKGTSQQNEKYANMGGLLRNVGETGIDSTITKNHYIYVASRDESDNVTVTDGPIPYGESETLTADFDPTIGSGTKTTSSGTVVKVFVNKGYQIYYNTNNTNIYITNSVNNKGCLIEDTNVSSAATWYFKEVGENEYNIYTKKNGTVYYVHQKSANSNEIELSTTAADTITIESGPNSKVYLKKDDENRWLQHSNGGGGIRYYTNKADAKNSQMTMVDLNTTDVMVSTVSYENLTINGNAITCEDEKSGSEADLSTLQALYSQYCSGGESNELYYITESVQINNFLSNDNHSPFVTTSPVFDITGANKSGQFLTGDGVLSAQYNSSAFRLITEATGNKKYTGYGTLTADDKALVKEQLSNSYTEYKGYLSSSGNSGKFNNFPLLVAENTDEKALTPIINNYLRVLTNTEYNFADEVHNTDIFEVGLYMCTFNGTSFRVDTTDACLDRISNNGEYYFKMDAKKVDTGEMPQFTLIDVQFKDPSDTTKVAYHLYVPLYVKKVLRYSFKAQLKSGTDYYKSVYTKFGELSQQGVFENIGNHVTILFEYQYTRTDQEWKDAVNGGDSLLTNYYKSLTIKDHLFGTHSSNNKFWPENTKMVLVDANNNDKFYYLDTLPTWTTDTAYIDLYDFTDTDSPGQHYKPVDFQDLMSSVVVGDPAEGETGNLLLTDSNGTALVRTINGTPYKATVKDTVSGLYYAFVETDDIPNDETGKCVTELRYNSTKNERYYLTIFTKQSEDSDCYHYEISCPNSFAEAGTGADDTSWTVESYRANRIEDNVSNRTVIHYYTGNLYENDLSLRVKSHTEQYEMNANNRFLTVTMTANISLTSSAIAAGVAANMSNFNSANASIYQTFLMMYDKLRIHGGTHEIGIDPDADYFISDQTYYYAKRKLTQEEKDMNESAFTAHANNTDDIREVERPENLEYSKYIEFRNNENLVDYISIEDTPGSNSYSAALRVDFDLLYETATMSNQFPLRDSENSSGIEGDEEDQNDIGAFVIGYSRISTEAASAANSATSKKETDNGIYYTTGDSSAVLTYNVVETNEHPAGPYSSLGINAVENGNTPGTVQTVAVYDTTKLKNAGHYIELNLTLSNKAGNGYYKYDGVSASGTQLKISDYLTELKIYGADSDEDGNDDVIFDISSATDTDTSTLVTENGDYNIRVRIDKSKLKTQKDDVFVIPINFNVRTGSGFSNAGLTYSNYKVLLTAAIYQSISGISYSIPSFKYDHVIYTNAKVQSSVLK